MKTCKICKIEKELTEFHTCGKYKDKVYYRGECTSCNKIHFAEEHKIAQKKYKKSEKGRATRKLRRNTEEYRAKAREYDKVRGNKAERKRKQYENLKRKLKEDPFFRLKHNLRNRVRGAFKAKRWYKNNSVIDFIGCDLAALKAHIESLFTEGMSWDNYGHGEKCWTLDHKYPLSLAKSEEEMYKLCHFTNLQPMWYIPNIKKGNKI
jgi:hypothetical protein